MEIKQQLRMSQQLVMTPQLQQAIKLLQMSRMELVDLVHEEMLENPVLEDIAELGVPLETPSSSSASVDNESRGEHEMRALEAAAPGDVPTQSDVSKEAEKKTDEIDWERYLENHALQAPLPSYRGGDEEMPGVEATLSRTEDLPDHLTWQARLTEFVEDEQRFAQLVIGNLTDDGYLKLAVSFEAVVSDAHFAQVQLSATGYYRTPEVHYDAARGRGKPFHYFSLGAALAEVEVDGLTGVKRVIAVDLLQDVGDSLHANIDRGQIEGAFVQGVGWLTGEELLWGTDGRLLSHSASTYQIPTFGDAPARFDVKLFPHATQASVVHGSKAVGEPPLMLAIAVREALRDAVAAFGAPGGCVTLPSPLTHEVLWHAVQARLAPRA